MVKLDDKIFITGTRGMVGSTTYELFKKEGFTNLIIAPRAELDLRDTLAVDRFFSEHKPEHVIHLAAKVGGINANIQNPVSFLEDNLLIGINVVRASYKHGVRNFMFTGSSCIYPRLSPQPMKEDYLLTGKLEPTNEGYALAKIATMKLLEAYKKQYNFKSVTFIPSNVYGSNDSFDLENAHVLSSLVKRFVDARKENKDTVHLWGTGRARREFLHVKDLANAILFFLKHEQEHDIINFGPGTDISIAELAYLIAQKTGFKGSILWDTSKPDGMPRKCMDVTRMRATGFVPKISLDAGIEEVIEAYCKTINYTI